MSEVATKNSLVLLVEDNPADALLIAEVISDFALPVDLAHCKDGEEAIRWIDRVDTDQTLPLPAMALLDLNLPRRSGHEVLRHLRASRRSNAVPVVIISSSDSPRDQEKVSGLGIWTYFHKPVHIEQFSRIGVIIGEILAAHPPD